MTSTHASGHREDGKDVAQLLSEGKYDLPTFLHYLKAHAVSGAQPDKAILLGILMQALARFHTSDFTACMCLVSSQAQDAPAVEKELAYMYELENLLSCGEFARFWAQWALVKEHLPESFHFESRVRTSILEVIALTMERVPVSRMAVYLAVPLEHVGRTVEAARQHEGEFTLVSCDDELVTFARTAFNYPEFNSNQDSLRFADIVSIV